MAAGLYDITIEQGANLVIPLTWKGGDGNPIDMTGYSARMQIRENFDSDDYLIALTSEPGGGISIDPLFGAILIELDATITAGLPQVDAVYDLELISISGFVTRMLQGRVYILREVTR